MVDELKEINYDNMIKQIANVSMIVGIVYVVLRALKAAGLKDGILQVPMKNVLRTSMLAAVVLPILIQQLRNLVVEGTDAGPKVLRNVMVAAGLAWVLVLSPASDVIGAPLISLARAPSPAIPPPPIGMSAGMMRRPMA